MTYKIDHKFRQCEQYHKAYYDRLCSDFANVYVPHMNYDDVIGVSFMKQDIRGNPSITFWNSRHCVPHQRHFSSMSDMRSFMEGFLVAKGERF